jgi:hypothetical protein
MMVTSSISQRKATSAGVKLGGRGSAMSRRVGDSRLRSCGVEAYGVLGALSIPARALISKAKAESQQDCD